ncbi:MAG: mate-domain-containing protein [Benniella sp.]|nr:MAG: mate-domain-containing protein [Benniella sp.]
MSSFPKHSFEQVYDNTFSSSLPGDSYSQGRRSTAANADNQGRRMSERSPLITKAPVRTHPSYTSNAFSPLDRSTGQRPRNKAPSATSASSADTLLGPEDAPDGDDNGRSLCGGASTDFNSSQALSIREMTLREFKILLRYSAPVVLTYGMQNSLQLASLLSLGRLGSIELASSSLASMFAAVTCWSVALGAATALDTLCAQCYTSQHPHVLGTHLQRAILVLMLFLVPIAGVWFSSEYIFLLLGQEPALAKHAALYLKGLLPGAPAYLIFECAKKFLQAQGNMHASTYVLLIVSPLNFLLTYLLVWNKYIGMGFIGAPIATSIAYWTMLLLFLLYIRFVDGYQGWGGWSRDCLTGWSVFLKLAVPGIMMVCTEWWAFEVVSLAASYLGTVSLAAQSIVVQTSGLLYTVPFGISIAASNRVGNLIGLGDALSAKVASRVSIALAIIFGLINSTVLIIFKDSWGRLFIDDVDVVKTVALILPLVSLYQVGDGLAGVGGGVLRGVGLQHLGAYLNLIAYYLVAFPLGYVLTFRMHWGLEGLWIALCIALWMVGLGELVVILRTNWVRAVSDCEERNSLVTKTRANCASMADDEESRLLDHQKP